MMALYMADVNVIQHLMITVVHLFGYLIMEYLYVKVGNYIKSTSGIRINM